MEYSREDRLKMYSDWVKALRSGEYTQGQLHLTTIEEDNEFDCCLGVFCKINKLVRTKLTHAYSYNFGASKSNTYLPSDFAHALNLEGGVKLDTDYKILCEIPRVKETSKKIYLSALNDAMFTFNEIADVIQYFMVDNFDLQFPGPPNLNPDNDLGDSYQPKFPLDTQTVPC